MEGIHVLRDLLRVGDWMAKVDLEDLVGRVLTRVRQQKITLVLIAPVWRS